MAFVDRFYRAMIKLIVILTPSERGGEAKVAMCIGLFALWLILNGRITAEVCLVGAVMAAGVYAFCVKVLGYRSSSEKGLWKRLWRYGWYVVVLIGEIMKANFAVMKVILVPPHRYEAAIVRVKVPLQRNSSRVILANSITLTPGTVTVAQEGEDFLVLCLHKKDAYEIPNWRLVKLLRELEEKGWN